MSNVSSKLSEKIAKLFARADHPNTTEHEAAACRDKAEKLMREHKISEAMLHLTEEQERVFEQHIVKTDWHGAVSYGTRQSIAIHVFKHAGCQTKHLWRNDEILHVVGYPADVFYGKILFERAIAELTEVLDPKWDDTLTEACNIYRYKNSGRTWEEVRGWFQLHAGKDLSVQALFGRYEKWRKVIGAEKVPGTRRHEAYRRSVETAFVRTLWGRLSELRIRSQQEEQEPGEYAIAIVKDEDALREEFYNLFPEMRPETQAEREAREAKSEAEYEAALKAEEARRAAMTEKQRQAEDRRNEREAKRAEREYQAYLNRNRQDAAGWAVGHSAAQKVRVLLNDEVKNEKVSLGS